MDQYVNVIVWDEFLQRRQLRVLHILDLTSSAVRSRQFLLECVILHQTYGMPKADEYINPQYIQNLPRCGSAKWR